MPRKIGNFANTAMDSHRWIVCHIRCTQYYMWKKKQPWSSTFVRYGNDLVPFSKQQYRCKQALGVRVTVGEKQKKHINKWPITNLLGFPSSRRRMCGFGYYGFSITISFYCGGWYLIHTSLSSNSKELRMHNTVWYLQCIHMSYVRQTWHQPSAAKFPIAS